MTRCFAAFIVFMAVLSAGIAAAQTKAAPPTERADGVFDRVWYAVTGTGRAGPAPDDAKQQGAEESTNASRNKAAELAPMKVSGADTSDKDTYKPDAGDYEK
jgi:hypothetical protein